MDSTIPANSYEAAEHRVRSSDLLNRYYDVLMSDWAEGELHWNWVALAPTSELVEWAETVRRIALTL